MYKQRPEFKSPHAKTWAQMANPNAIINLNIYLHPAEHEQEAFASIIASLETHPATRTYEKGMLPADKNALTALYAFAKHYYLSVADINLDTRVIALSGSIAQFSQAFKVHFAIYYSEDGAPHLNYEGHLTIPNIIAPYVVHIGGLNYGLNKAGRSKIQENKTPNKQQMPDQDGAPVIKGFTPQKIEKIYNFPDNDAAGECIGLIELGGHYTDSDISNYCQLHQIPVPEIVVVGEEPTVPEGAQMIDNLEVTMDIQIAAGLAPHAKIVIYYAKTIEDAIHLAINDTENNPSVLSISWALSEANMSASERQQIDYLSLEAAKRGITLVAASGDYGAYNKKETLNIMSPASNPLVLACGGTALHGHDEEYREIVWESNMNPKVFNASGGGFSQLYQKPNYQTQAINNYKFAFPNQKMGRSTPDISANSAAETAYNIVINGHQGAWGGGTSASTPVWAALIARINKSLGYRIGFINPWLYKMAGTPAFNQVLYGSNGYYPAAYGWNAATGLGTPNGQAIRDAIKAAEPKTAQ